MDKFYAHLRVTTRAPRPGEPPVQRAVLTVAANTIHEAGRVAFSEAEKTYLPTRYAVELVGLVRRDQAQAVGAELSTMVLANDPPRTEA